MRRVIVVLLLVLVGCVDNGNWSRGPDLGFAPAFVAHDKIDILFVLGNEASTSQYRFELRRRFPELVRALSDAGAQHPASYHIGVITADLGAGPYTFNSGQCHPGGDGGKLQVAPMAGTSPPAGCSSFSLDGGVRFIDWDQAA